MTRNGHLKRWLISTLTTIFLGLAGWTALTLVNHEGRVSATEAQLRDVMNALDKMDKKLDRLLIR